MPRLLNIAASMVIDACATPEAREAVESLLAWPDEQVAKILADDPAEKERRLRATWGMGPEAEAGQAAMTSMIRTVR